MPIYIHSKGIYLMSYNNIIRNLRIQKYYTQKQVADFLCICQKTYSDYELGYTRIPIESLILLAQLNNVDMNNITSVSSRFNKRSGILYLYDKETSNKLLVETNMAYRVITSEDKRIIKIKIDNEEDIRIQIK